MTSISNNISLEELEEFLGSRYLPDSLKKQLIQRERKIENTIYRGLPFPKQFLKIGRVLEEWNFSSHWSLDKKVAIGFSDDYINEEYVEDVESEIGEKPDMIKLVLYSNDITGTESYKILESLDKENVFLKEKEITVIGYDFMIEDIVEDGDVFFAKVKPVKNESRMEIEGEIL